MDDFGPESPCIGVCTLDAATRCCIGCHRTSEEIAGWRQFTRQQKTAVLDRLAALHVERESR